MATCTQLDSAPERAGMDGEARVRCVTPGARGAEPWTPAYEDLSCQQRNPHILGVCLSINPARWPSAYGGVKI